MTDHKNPDQNRSDLSHLRAYHCAGSGAALSAPESLTQLLDLLEMTAAQLEEMCGEESPEDDLF